jgi:hypothetical protein
LPLSASGGGVKPAGGIKICGGGMSIMVLKCRLVVELCKRDSQG